MWDERSGAQRSRRRALMDNPYKRPWHSCRARVAMAELFKGRTAMMVTG